MIVRNQRKTHLAFAVHIALKDARAAQTQHRPCHRTAAPVVWVIAKPEVHSARNQAMVAGAVLA